MILAIECVVFCLIMWLICFLGTGNDEKNFKSINAYPDEVVEIVKNHDNYKDRYKSDNQIVKFISNLIVFLVILLVFGIFIRTGNVVTNFLSILLIGEMANLFDLLVIDMLWWRNIKRIRFSFIPEKEKYKSMKKHLISFVKGAVMFLIVALIDGAILILF